MKAVAGVCAILCQGRIIDQEKHSLTHTTCPGVQIRATGAWLTICEIRLGIYDECLKPHSR